MVDYCWLVPVATNQPIRNSWDGDMQHPKPRIFHNVSSNLGTASMTLCAPRCTGVTVPKFRALEKHYRTGAAELKPDTPTEYHTGTVLIASPIVSPFRATQLSYTIRGGKQLYTTVLV